MFVRGDKMSTTTKPPTINHEADDAGDDLGAAGVRFHLHHE